MTQYGQSKIIEVRDICSGQKYTNRFGEEKTKWTKHGVMFIKDNGAISIKMDSFPIGHGNLVAFKQQKKDGKGNSMPGEVPTIQVEETGEVPPGTEIPTADGEINPEDIPF